MCVREGEMQGTTTQSCRCWHSAQRAQWGGRRKDGARTTHFDPRTTLGSCSASEEPRSGPREEDWTCTSLGCSCSCEISPLWPGSWLCGFHCQLSLNHCLTEVCSTWYDSLLSFHQPLWTHPRHTSFNCFGDMSSPCFCTSVWCLSQMLLCSRDNKLNTINF